MSELHLALIDEFKFSYAPTRVSVAILILTCHAVHPILKRTLLFLLEC